MKNSTYMWAFTSAQTEKVYNNRDKDLGSKKFKVLIYLDKY